MSAKKGLADLEIRRGELALKEREIALREKEAERLATEARRSRWWNPLVIAIVGATIAASGNAVVSWINGAAEQRTEALKAESARILEAIKTGSPEKASDNLQFLVATGLLLNPTAAKVEAYLKSSAHVPYLANTTHDLIGMVCGAPVAVFPIAPGTK